jgi:hypothetical protein
MPRLRHVAPLVAVSVFVVASAAHAAAPMLLPIQGRLYANTGVAVDGPHTLKFDLFQTETGGTAVFSETREKYSVTKGDFIVYLGELAADAGAVLDLALFRDKGTLFLEVTIDSAEVISPRFRIGTVPYAGFAQYCGDAMTLGGNPPAYYYSKDTHRVAWSELTGTPGGFADGTDNDALGSVACQTGQVPKYLVGGSPPWVCAKDEVFSYAADGASIELVSRAAPLDPMFRVKASGITTTEIADGTIDTADMKDPFSFTGDVTVGGVLHAGLVAPQCSMAGVSSINCACPAGLRAISGGVNCGAGAVLATYPQNGGTGWSCACSVAGVSCHVICARMAP